MIGVRGLEMKMNLSRNLAALGAVVLVGAASSAIAQDAAPATPQEPPKIVELYTPADAQAVLDARLAALKTVIGLTPEQAKLWPPVETAIREAAEKSAARRAERIKAQPPEDFVDLLVRTGDAEIVRGQELKTVAAALKPLVASLSDEQKRRIPAFLGLREDPSGLPQPTAELWIFEEEQ